VRSLSGPEPGPEPEPGPGPGPSVHLPAATLAAQAETRTIRLVGAVPSELWNRIGTKLLPKLKSGSDLKIEVNFSVTVQRDVVGSLAADLRQVLDELQLADKVQIRDA
jgi:hypothetical protein